MKAYEQLGELYHKGSNALELFQKQATSPKDYKVLRTWGISDAAKMIGRSPQTLRNLEEANKIPKAQITKKNKKEIREYTLTKINQIREILNVRPHKPEGSITPVIGITNFKGGVGKSFTSITFAQALTMLGFKVLIIDSDSQGTTTHLGGGFIPDLQINADQTLLKILIGESTDLSKCIFKTHWDSLDMIPANLALYNAEMIIPQQVYVHRQKTGQTLPFYTRFSNALNKIKDNYDVVVIDTPPSLGFATMNVIYSLDGMIIPLQPSPADFASTVQFTHMAQESLRNLPKENFLFTKFLITRYKNTIQASDMKDVIEQVWGEHVLKNRIVESEAVSKSSANLKTIYETEPHPNDKRTYKRATNFTNAVTEEIVEELYKIWKVSKIDQPLLSLSEVL